MASSRHKNLSHLEKMLAKQISTYPVYKMNPRYKVGIWHVMRNSAECFIGTADGVFRVREIRRLELQSSWNKEAIKNVNEDGRWTVVRPEIRVDPVPILPLPF